VVEVAEVSGSHVPDLSRRFAALPSYPLSDLPALKRELRRRGVDLIDLGVGDADLPPPPAAVAALAAAAGDPANSRYSFQLGLPALREEIAAWSARRFDVTLDPYREVLPLIGSKEGIFHLPFAYLDPGDIAIIPDPAYQAYLGGTRLAGGEPHIVPLRAEHDFLIPLEDIPSSVARRAKLLYLNYPNNPTTAVAPREYLLEVLEFCRRHDILLVYDNAYSEIAFDGYDPPSILAIDGAREVCVEFHSLSKTYNMTGWRVGWAAGGEAAIAALTKVKTFSDTGVPFTIQHAALAALRGHASWLPANVDTFRSRRNAAVASLRSAGIEIAPPRATMYLWVPLPAGARAEAFARRLLLEQAVAVLPGVALGEGGEGFCRIALTVPEERLREAAERMARVL
jgi:LL-diaminopimelate aminotransferase